ncbi:MAG TPA: hypothetical protein DCZ11_02710 [Gammaproteobacteria bacterium]|jgi:hypothetical protein|uniref:hypothetical protein n=1 Tax=Immundisolibacter sp. TaxID=1934948 RepID=UPI000E8ED6FC|nr:hypothetical protein [Gammaproteobacteria bacterium]HCZ47898.1 hypothetical protein [Gammaproteobacteria bacterium]MCH77336.1 hypothetical protein [Gammaproteobacteria bacterium]
MANTSVFTGADGSITLSTVAANGREAEAAQGIIDGNDLVTIGRATGVSLEVRAEVRPFHELGQRYATELRPGNVSVRGTIQRAYLNGALLRLLLGEAADGRPAQSWAQPAFNITLLAENAAVPGVRSTLTLHGVKLDQWSYTLPEDDFVMESAAFQALYLTVADEGA